MKFLLDVCASSRALRALLSDLGHDVLSALERDPRASDEALLALAMQEARVLVTEDKDFGELVFVRRLPHPCIIRFVDMRVEEKVTAMRELLERHADTIRDGALIVVTRRRICIRFEVRDNGGKGCALRRRSRARARVGVKRGCGSTRQATDPPIPTVPRDCVGGGGTV